MNNTAIERKLIKKLGEIKIDHTDFDDDGFNRLCSEEIIKIVDITEAFLSSELEKARGEVKCYLHNRAFERFGKGWRCEDCDNLIKLADFR